jgi:hypothetical protein
MDIWWELPAANPAGETFSLRTDAQDDRTYFRVCCRGSAGEQVFDLYHDAVTGVSVLEVTHDKRQQADP